MFLDIWPWGALSLLVTVVILFAYKLGVEVGKSRKDK